MYALCVFWSSSQAQLRTVVLTRDLLRVYKPPPAPLQTFKSNTSRHRVPTPTRKPNPPTQQQPRWSSPTPPPTPPWPPPRQGQGQVIDQAHTESQGALLTKVVIGAVILVVTAVVFGVVGFRVRRCVMARKAKKEEASPA